MSSFSLLQTPQKIDDAFLNELNLILEDDASWQENKRYSDNVTVTYTREFPQIDQSLTAIKLVTQIKAPIERVVDLLHDRLIEKHKEWNKYFSEGQYLQRFSQDENVQYWRFSTGVLTDDRDLVIARRKYKTNDGEIILIDTSVRRPDTPVPKGVTRSQLYFHIRKLKPLSNNLTRLSSAILVDVRGKVPTFLENWVNPVASATETFAIRDILEKETQQVY